MTDTPHPRALLTASPAEILGRLPEMGRIMLSTRAGGATHERMGPVETVTIDGGEARLSGSCHDSRIDLSVVVRLVADRTSRMRDLILPRLECQDGAGEVLFSQIGLDGLEPFDTALARFGAGEALDPVEREVGAGGATDISDEDLGARSFAAILASGVGIAIDVERPGLFQHWSGLLPEPKPAMGFVNLMQGDFHLHLKAGAVAQWRREDVGEVIALHARDAAGHGIGLVLRGPAEAFAAVPDIHPHHG